jgi:hypothetical protein
MLDTGKGEAMRHSNRFRPAALLLLAAALAVSVLACSRGGQAAEEETGYRDATVEPVKGTDLSRVTLSQQAAERLGIQTAKVRAGTSGRTVIPYAAVLYDETGDTWTFTSPQPLTYLRQHVKIDLIQGEQAILLEGPPVGTAVVTVGAAELLGTELGVGEE